MEKEYVDLYTLQIHIRDGLEGLFPDRLWVRAEISSLSVKSNGHCYLELSQNDDAGITAKARAVVWRSVFIPINHYFKELTGSELQTGMSVLVRAKVNYSELYGLTLIVDEIEPEFTIGRKELERRRTIARLEEDGMFDLQKRLSLPLLPYRLAVISAGTAAGFGDFCHHLLENEFGFKFGVDLFEALMQGSGAPESIIDALEEIEVSGTGYDAVLIMRGGGSNLDLDCFDDYGLALAIAQFPIPVFTAIGHDRDYHVADMVSFEYVKTPTALADRFLDCYMAEDERISSFGSRLRLAFYGKLSQMSSRVDVLEARIRAADPRNILARGFTLATDASGVVLKSAESVREGDVMGILFRDGSVRAEVSQVTRKPSGTD